MLQDQNNEEVKKTTTRTSRAKSTKSTTSKSSVMAKAKTSAANYFTSLINDSDSNLLQKRGDLVARATEEELGIQLMNAKKERNNIEFQIATMEDLGKTESTSLTVGGDFNPSNWIENIFVLEEQLLNVNITISILEKMSTKYFGANA